MSTEVGSEGSEPSVKCINTIALPITMHVYLITVDLISTLEIVSPDQSKLDKHRQASPFGNTPTAPAGSYYNH